MKTRIRLLLAIILCIAWVVPANAQSDNPKLVKLSDGVLAAIQKLQNLDTSIEVPEISTDGTLAGKVIDSSGNPIRGAKVTIANMDACPARTDEFGTFELSLPADRDAALRVQAMGYQTLQKDVHVLPWIKTPVTFTLQSRENFLQVVLEHQDMTHLQGVFDEAISKLQVTPKGRKYLNIFDDNSEQLISIYTSHPKLWNPTRILLQRLVPVAENLALAAHGHKNEAPLFTSSNLDLTLEILDAYSAYADEPLASELQDLAGELIEMRSMTAEQMLAVLGPLPARTVQSHIPKSVRPITTP